MKINKDVKFIMQCNSFAGIIAALSLIHMGCYISIAYAGLVINSVCLIIWCFAEEEDEKEGPKE
jgi:hypothetical protein